jgi:hypothetical protein
MQRKLLNSNATYLIGVRSASKGLRALTFACAAGFMPVLFAGVAFADSFVEFDVAPIAECRDVTPPQRIAQYPNQRLIEVWLPISARFRGLETGDVDEIHVEVSGSWGMRVHDFSPKTELTSDITHEIETTTTTKKSRSLDGTLGGTLPIPGADAAAHLTPSITAGLSNCNTATEKINRLPPKHAVVVSGTSSSGRGVFFKLKRSSQTSLEGVHELSVTFVAPRAWQRSEIMVGCAAHGERKTMLWMKEEGTIGQATRTMQLVEMGARPVRQTVMKPADAPPTVVKAAPKPDKPMPPTESQWRAVMKEAVSAEVAAQLSDEATSTAARDKKKVAAKEVSTSISTTKTDEQ